MLKPLAKLFLRITGWRSEGGLPVERKFVLIAAPHTSNWDLAYLLALAETYDVRVSWMGKHTLFRGPLGWLMRAVGGIPVRRDRRNSLVKQMAEEFRRRDELILTVPAEGTRGYTPHWKSGFYAIAREANVPIVMGFLDYERKVGGFGPALIPTGDIRADMDEFRAFYSAGQARYPDLFGEVRLKEEM